MGRRQETATWGLTDGEGGTVGVVKHGVRWFPRPVWMGEGVGVEGWRATFVVTGGGVEAGGGKLSKTVSAVMASETRERMVGDG